MPPRHLVGLLAALAWPAAAGGGNFSAASCEYFRGSRATDSPPFDYWRTLPNGTKVAIEPVADASGVCVYPTDACASEKLGQKCCNMSKGFSKTSILGLTPGNLNLYLGLLVLVVPFWVQKCCDARKATQLEDRSERREQQTKAAISCAIHILFMVAVCFEIWLMIAVAMMTQDLLPVPTRNTLLATSVFMTPIREVFQFIEDVMTVKINAELGSKNTAKVREVLATGVAGGLLSGIIAAGIITGLCHWSGVVEWLLVPYGGHDELTGCPLVPRGQAIVDDARPFVILSAWAWPFQFANMALRGFLIGIGDWWSFLGAMLLEQGLGLLGMWGYFVFTPTLTVLGWISFVAPASAFGAMLVLLVLRPGIRTVYICPRPQKARHPAASPGLRSDRASSGGPESSPGISEHQDDAASSSDDLAPQRSTSFVQTSAHAAAVYWETINEGLLAMVSDVAVQLPLTIGVYMAGMRLGMGAMYQISALQTAFPLYGVAWVRGLTYAFRIVGSQMVGARNLPGFRDFFHGTVRYVSLLAIVAFVTTAFFPKQISFDLAAQACEYATIAACLPIYGAIFGGGSFTGETLEGSAFKYFVPSLLASCFYQVFKAGLYACQDFRFMARAGCLALLVVFVPSVFVAVWIGSAGAILIPMYLPTLVLAVAFAMRINRNIGRMERGTFRMWEQSTEGSDSEADDSDESDSDDNFVLDKSAAR